MNKRLKFNHLFFDGLFRSPCLLCLAPNSSALGLCQPCLDDLPWLPDALCSQCALPCTDKVCGHCLSDPPYFDACYGVFSYQFPISALLQDYKYGSKLHLARSFALLLKNRSYSGHRHRHAHAPTTLKRKGFQSSIGNCALALCRASTEAGFR